MNHQTSYEHGLAAVSEGICPEHHIALERSGWCHKCRTWWSIRHDPDPLDIGSPVLVARYPYLGEETPT